MAWLDKNTVPVEQGPAEEMAANVALSRLERELQAAEIITGPRVYVRKKFYYTGHATTTYSIEQASTIIDFIGSKTECDDCLPFAVRLVEGGELISIAEDNGEFACGEILKACLTKLDGFNVLVCVSRHVDGMFVTDMVQSQKHRAVKEAAAKVLEVLKDHLTNASKKSLPVVDASNTAPPLQPRDSFFFDSKKVLEESSRSIGIEPSLISQPEPPQEAVSVSSKLAEQGGMWSLEY